MERCGEERVVGRRNDIRMKGKKKPGCCGSEVVASEFRIIATLDSEDGS